MKRVLLSAIAASGMFLASMNVYAKACTFADANKVKEHIQTHITYPMSGKDIKAACVKEMPNEFSSEEHACIEKNIKDKKTYKNSKEVAKALGVNF